MIKVIPAILSNNTEDFFRKIKLIRPYVKLVQLDVADGHFVANKSFGGPREVSQIKDLFWEIHLMVFHPEDQINSWLKISNVKRIIFHWEAIPDRSGELKQNFIKNILNRIYQEGKEGGIAINPETPVSVLSPFFSVQIASFLIMTVNPGFSGQKFLNSSLAKIKNLRNSWHNGEIEVDGGINPLTGHQAVKAGADVLVAGSYIFSHSKDIQRALERLKTLDEV